MSDTYRNGIRVEPEEGYNGWTNRATWLVKLWIDNDAGSYHYWRDQARGYIGHSDADETMLCLADQLKDEHEANAPRNAWHARSEASVYTDLLGVGLGSVNWYEIADSLIDEAKEEA